MERSACFIRTPKMVCVCVCVFMVTHMFWCEEDEARSSRHPLGFDLWEILVTCDHDTVHVGDSAPCWAEAQTSTPCTAAQTNPAVQITFKCLWEKYSQNNLYADTVIHELTWWEQSISLSIRPTNHLSHFLQSQLLHQHEHWSDLISEPVNRIATLGICVPFTVMGESGWTLKADSFGRRQKKNKKILHTHTHFH